MKTRIFLAAVVAATVLSPARAHAGAAEAICSPGGVLLLASTDSSLLEFARLWDFEVRSAKANGVDVPFALSSGTNDFETYTITQPIPAGQTVTFEFRQVRNLTEGGDGFASTWTTHTVDAPSCTASSVITVVATSLGAPTTTVGSGVSLANTTTVAGSGTGGSAPLPKAGSDSTLLLGTAAGLLAAGSLIVVASRRRTA